MDVIQLLDTGYLYAKNPNRIFINTCLGCTGWCSYCYLPQIGYNNNSHSVPIRTASEILQDIQSNGYPISSKTLVTLGCFSECWDDNNKPQTIELIRHFLSQGNQVQLSTKKQIHLSDILPFQDLIQYQGQLVIFVSSATISKHQTIEHNTDSPDSRFKTFDISRHLDIPTVLYMKPILQGITVQDIDLYRKVIQDYHIKDVVVGSIFKEHLTDETVPFSNKKQLFYNPVSDEIRIKNGLRDLCDIFSRSTQVMNKYREKSLDLDCR